MKSLKKYFKNLKSQSLLEYTLLLAISIVAIIGTGMILRAKAEGGRVEMSPGRWVETGLSGFFNTTKNWILGNKP
jgi:hypothetical protein